MAISIRMKCVSLRICHALRCVLGKELTCTLRSYVCLRCRLIFLYSLYLFKQFNNSCSINHSWKFEALGAVFCCCFFFFFFFFFFFVVVFLFVFLFCCLFVFLLLLLLFFTTSEHKMKFSLVFLTICGVGLFLVGL